MKIIVIGHRGYIGSYLCNELSMKVDSHINDNFGKRGKEVDVSDADVVIYLGGIAGHQYCAERTEREVFDANVSDIMSVGLNMKRGAFLIYASTSALYEGYGMSEPREDMLLYEHVFDRYTSSMYNREKNIRTLTHIKSAALRLGTVIGISPNQKRTSIHIKMLRDAVLFGKVRVQGAHMGRSILSLSDLKAVVELMIEKRDQVKGHQVYNLCSFNCTVAKIANEIGCKTGCNIIYEQDSEQQKRSLGFSMNTNKITKEFGVEWRGRNSDLVEELIRNIKYVCNSDTYLQPATDNAKCRVCKKEEHMAILYDFGKQPNANHYLSLSHGKLEEYPLRLDVCRNCYHTQLSYTIPPEDVFSNYIYLSGTSNTMRDFFREFADKSIKESGKMDGGTVLEIACNDGSLLDWYKARGWKTYGYDPAQNIYEISSGKGHNVTVGFWGQDRVPEYPSLDIIVAQNVCAHVPDPVVFLTKCREVMNDSTVLYIQTSQSDMIERGQYDTAYHEHLSFFTVRSMDIAGKMAGLCLDGVEKTPVHGSSYIFRFKLQSTTDITQNAIYKYEKEIGLYDDLLYYVYVEKVNELSQWLNRWQNKLTEKGVKMVGYGAAAKGMTVLNSLNTPLALSYIADDSKVKQGYYATNQKYRIVAPGKLAESKEPIAVYVLAWNFIDEIKQRVMKVRGDSPTYFLVTYPLKTVWYVDSDGNEYKMYEEVDTRFTRNSVYHKNILISHFYNEEALLIQWIRHHAPLFNCAVLIDYNSTDNSRDIIRREAPDSWNVVNSYNSEFGAVEIDMEVAGYENSFDNNDWRLALTTTEFLFATGLRRKENPIFGDMGDAKAIRIQSLTSVDRENSLKNDKSIALLRQKNLFYFQRPAVAGRHEENNILTKEEESYVNNHYNRFMHCVRDFTNPYFVGRHDFRYKSVQSNMHIIKYMYSPFPEFFSRKLQIKTRIPESDKQFNFGHQHFIELDKLNADYRRRQELPLIPISDEESQLAYFDKYMRDICTSDQLLSGIFMNLFDIY
jgi:nucleoside-diphosphate-sugar epimerase/2-polyprenyl-3-methyl-5-hydroxy-6-metoxy-1,4-benzoquinol methylase